MLIVIPIVMLGLSTDRGSGMTMMTMDHPPSLPGTDGGPVTLEKCRGALARLILGELEAMRRAAARRTRRPPLRPRAVPTVQSSDLDKKKAQQVLAQMGLRRTR